MAPPNAPVFPSLKDKIAIVTGATRGIGKQVAFHLAQCGAKVVITYTSESSKPAAEELIKRIASETNSTAIAIQRDLRNIDSPAQIVAETVKAFGHVDILVNNAGILKHSSVEDTSVEDYEELFQINVRAPFLMMKAVMPHLRHPARIINMSSIGAREAFGGTGIYMASKGALEAFTRNWAAELGSRGTTVNAVNPGSIQTDMLDQLPAAEIEKVKARTLVENRVGTVEEVAYIVAFLAEERSSWVTGQCIAASGGFQVY